jgi:adenosylhomocysteine nucleosidase
MSNVIGIIGAMDIEVNGIVLSMSNVSEKTISGIKFFTGTLHNKNVVVAKCGIGKVFAAICTQTMILEYKPAVIINSGVAGSLTNELGVLNVALAKNVVQHDMDTSPLGDPKGLISGINIIYFDANEGVLNMLEKSAQIMLCKCICGTIASGDKFISNPNEKKALYDEFGAIACEMEGGAIAHTCYINNVPFGIIRAISDGEGAEMDYSTFAIKAANQSIEIVKNFVKMYEV